MAIALPWTRHLTHRVVAQERQLMCARLPICPRMDALRRCTARWHVSFDAERTYRGPDGNRREVACSAISGDGTRLNRCDTFHGHVATRSRSRRDVASRGRRLRQLSTTGSHARGRGTCVVRACPRRAGPPRARTIRERDPRGRHAIPRQCPAGPVGETQTGTCWDVRAAVASTCTHAHHVHDCACTMSMTLDGRGAGGTHA